MIRLSDPDFVLNLSNIGVIKVINHLARTLPPNLQNPIYFCLHSYVDTLITLTTLITSTLTLRY